MSYKTMFEEKASLSMRVNKITKSEKVSPDHDVNVRVYYGTQESSFSHRLETRLVCEIPMSKGALQQLATDLWNSGIYPKQAIVNAQRTKESLCLADAILEGVEL